MPFSDIMLLGPKMKCDILCSNINYHGVVSVLHPRPEEFSFSNYLKCMPCFSKRQYIFSFPFFTVAFYYILVYFFSKQPKFTYLHTCIPDFFPRLKIVWHELKSMYVTNLLVTYEHLNCILSKCYDFCHGAVDREILCMLLACFLWKSFTWQT
ncbi:hypothetical protein FOCC_FOCC005330 [Frankliniella occidentalis]|nr:hypothetical protein FOCC_FOCC005330 [Frankliniella occidentalis]